MTSWQRLQWRIYGAGSGRRANPIRRSPPRHRPYPGGPELDENMINDSSPGVSPSLHANGTKMILPPQTRDLAQLLSANEAAAGNTSESVELAAFRVCDTLRPPVCALAGVDGFRALLSRALALARAEAPILSVLQVAADGSLQGLDEIGGKLYRSPAPMNSFNSSSSTKRL